MNGTRAHAALLDIYITSIILMFLFIGFIMFPLMLRKIYPAKCFPLFYCLYTNAFFYMIIRDNLGHRSIGKRIMGLKVIDKNTGHEANATKRFLRNITLVIWPVDLVFLIISGQRIGDKLTGTKIIPDPKTSFKAKKAY